MAKAKKASGGGYLYDGVRYTKNRIRRLERHLKKFPNDAVAKEATKNIKYRRDKPKAFKKVWTPGKKWYAQVLRQLGLNGNIALQAKPKMPLKP